MMLHYWYNSAGMLAHNTNIILAELEKPIIMLDRVFSLSADR